MPILLDVHQGVTRGLGSHEAPEAILVDPRQWSMVYRGPLEIRTSLGKKNMSSLLWPMPCMPSWKEKSPLSAI